MIPRKTNDVSTISSNFDGESIEMTIDEGSLRHIMSVLTDLYSDTALAVIRELSTNARDSHIEAGRADVPIQVSLPSPLSPAFRVKDFGVGLSLEDIRNVFSKYGASTKRGSDSVNGMLGLGAKAPLTYTSSFTIMSVKDGVKNIVSVGRHDDGGGSMEIIDTFNTHEDNGVEIQVPVPSHSAYTFSTKAKDFYEYWEAGLVEVDGVLNTGFSDSNFIKINDRTYFSSTYDGSLESTIVMGGVPYPAPFPSAFPSRYSKFVYFADIGDAVFSPSRESLLTNKQNRELFDSIVNTIKATAESAAADRVNEASNKIEALRVSKTAINDLVHPIVGASASLVTEMTYKGATIESICNSIYDVIADVDVFLMAKVTPLGSTVSPWAPVVRGANLISPSRKYDLCQQVLTASAVVTGITSEQIHNSNRRGAIWRGLREMGYQGDNLIFVSDHAEFAKETEGFFKVITIGEIREASKKALKDQGKKTPAKKRVDPSQGLADVITGISSDAVMTTEAKAISGDGSDIVFLARGDVRSTSVIRGYNAHSRAITFRSVMNQNPDITFVAVRDSESGIFKTHFPKARSYREFSYDLSKKSFMDKVIKDGGGAFTETDVASYINGRESGSYGYDEDINFITLSRKFDHEQFKKYAAMSRTYKSIAESMRRVAKDVGEVYSDRTFFDYVQSTYTTVEGGALLALYKSINNRYPLVKHWNGRNIDHFISYVKAVDSGVIA